MNEAGMLSGEWHKSNDHLKSLITEDYVSIERKGLENQDCGHFPGFIVLSNHDAPIRVEQGDGRIVCLDVSPRCKGNFKYFDQLGKILEHPDTPGSFMGYLLNQDLSNWKPEKNMPTTKMKTETMREHLPNPIRFIIDHISVWSKDQIEKPGCAMLYQEYRTWCEANGEKPFSNNNFGKKIPQVNIERKRAGGGKREWQYILDRSKIVAKLRELVGDIEEFSDTPQAETSSNASTDIPVFNVPEIVDPKGHCFAINSQPEKIDPIPLTTNRIEKGKEIVSSPPITNMTQDLFDSIIDQPKYSVALSSKSTNISLPPEIEHVEPSDDKSKPSIENIKSVENKPKISPVLSTNDEPKTSNEETPTQISYPPGYQTREQREIRLRQKAIELGEDPEIFITITDKDKLDSIAFRDRMQTDARMCGYAKEAEENPSEYMDMTVRERLISEEIIRRSLEEDGITTSWLDTDEEWKKTINILQENGMLW